MSTADIKPMAMRDAFLEALLAAMKQNDRIFLLSADFGSPVIDKIRADCPNRFINVGIAEQNLINVAAGLSLEGFIVFAYAIAPFITMRCYEQIRVNLSLLSQVRKMNVNLVGVGAGYSYVVSGPTHQCYEDITIMRAMPAMQVMSPCDHITSMALLDTCLKNDGPKYLRFDAQPLPVIYAQAPDMQKGFHVHRKGKQVCLLATGYMLHTAFKVADNLKSLSISAGVIDLFNLSRFSQDALAQEIGTYEQLVTLEEGFSGRGGVDALMFDFTSGRHMNLPILNIGVNGQYQFELGNRTELHEKAGIGADIVTERVRQFLAARKAA
jgi:transketolase